MQSGATETDCVRRTEMSNCECPVHEAGDVSPLTLVGLDPTPGISLRAYMLQSAWAHEERADWTPTQRS